MPLYEYRCELGHVTEALKAVLGDPNAASERPACPACGRPTKLVVSAIARTPAKWGDTK